MLSLPRLSYDFEAIEAIWKPTKTELSRASVIKC